MRRCRMFFLECPRFKQVLGVSADGDRSPFWMVLRELAT